MRDGQFLYKFCLMVFFLIVLTVLLVIAGIIVASDVNGRMAAEKQQEADLLIDARLAPAGTLAVGEQAAETTAAVVVAAAEVSGESVYSQACIICHREGIAGAPVVGSTDAWVDRIAQGLDLLNERAINGYQGSAGYMPPKGGNPTLSDAQVKAAVQYMVEQSQ